MGEMAKDIKHSVHDIRESWQNTEVKTSSEVASSTGALDSACCDDELVEIGSAKDRRTPVERRYESVAAVKNVKAIVNHTAQVSEGLWRQASHSVKQGLRSFGATAEVDPRTNDEFSFWMLPSSRANYVELHGGRVLARVPNGAGSTQQDRVDLHNACMSAGDKAEIQPGPSKSSAVGSITIWVDWQNGARRCHRICSGRLLASHRTRRAVPVLLTTPNLC